MIKSPFYDQGHPPPLSRNRVLSPSWNAHTVVGLSKSLSPYQVWHGLPARENTGKMPVPHNSGMGSKCYCDDIMLVVSTDLACSREILSRRERVCASFGCVLRISRQHPAASRNLPSLKKA